MVAWWRQAHGCCRSANCVYRSLLDGGTDWLTPVCAREMLRDVLGIPIWVQCRPPQRKANGVSAPIWHPPERLHCSWWLAYSQPTPASSPEPAHPPVTTSAALTTRPFSLTYLNLWICEWWCWSVASRSKDAVDDPAMRRMKCAVAKDFRVDAQTREEGFPQPHTPSTISGSLFSSACCRLQTPQDPRSYSHFLADFLFWPALADYVLRWPPQYHPPSVPVSLFLPWSRFLSGSLFLVDFDVATLQSSRFAIDLMRVSWVSFFAGSGIAGEPLPLPQQRTIRRDSCPDHWRRSIWATKVGGNQRRNQRLCRLLCLALVQR